jgi:hypothetical protein
MEIHKTVSRLANPLTLSGCQGSLEYPEQEDEDSKSASTEDASSGSETGLETRPRPEAAEEKDSEPGS